MSFCVGLGSLHIAYRMSMMHMAIKTIGLTTFLIVSNFIIAFFSTMVLLFVVSFFEAKASF